MTESQPVIEVAVAAAPSVVWQALRDPELIRRWHGWDYAGLADEIREIYFDDVTEDAAACTLALNGADTFSLHEHEGTTLVRITRPPRSGDRRGRLVRRRHRGLDHVPAVPQIRHRAARTRRASHAVPRRPGRGG